MLIKYLHGSTSQGFDCLLGKIAINKGCNQSLYLVKYPVAQLEYPSY